MAQGKEANEAADEARWGEAAAGARQQAPAQDKRAAWRLLASLMRPYRWRALATLTLLLCDVTGMLYIPTELSALVNAAISHQADTLSVHGLRMLAAAVLGSGGCIASYWMATHLAADVGRDLRVAVYEKSLSLSAADFARLGTGSMITRTMGDANVVQQTLVMCFVMIAPVPVACVVAAVLAFSTDWQMGWVILAVTAGMLAVCAAALARSAPIFVRMQGLVDAMNTRLRESITGVRVIRAFGRQRLDRERLDETFEGYAASAIRVNMTFTLADSVTFFLANGVEVLVTWVGANRVGAHAMQIGSITALVNYAMIVMFSMMMAQFAILQVPRMRACLGRAAEVLDTEPRVRDAPGAGEADRALASTGGQAEVARFDHVSFRFDDADEDTLHDLTFSLRRGQVTAVIGNTGSGKSTVAKLLLRLFDVTGGAIRVQGRDLRDLPQREARRHVAYVPQQAWLFSGTIGQNLRDGRADATDEELWHALDVAQAGFVRDLPGGLEARVSQGGKNFSGGQRQRLAIARALVRHADLYVFDDSFSALDYRTDAALRHALAGELTDAATLLIAQRVSTIRDAGQIVVLDEGRVVGLGTHEELLRTCRAYQEIEESQARGGEAHE